MDLLTTTSSPCLFLCGGPFSYFLITFKIYLREMRVHVRLEIHGYNGYNVCNDWGGGAERSRSDQQVSNAAQSPTAVRGSRRCLNGVAKYFPDLTASQHRGETKTKTNLSK